MYNRDLLLELFDGILASGADATGIKAAVAGIRNEETISEEEKEDETEDVTDPQENPDRDNSPIAWLDSLPASPRAAINDSISDTPSKDGNPDLQFGQDITQDVRLSTQGKTSFSQETPVFLSEKSGSHVSTSVQSEKVTKKATVSAHCKKNQLNIWFTPTNRPKRKKK